MTDTEKLYMNETEASKRYGYSCQWFQRKRWLGDGPKYLKMNNGKVLYPTEETDLWFQSFGYKKSTSEYICHQKKNKTENDKLEN